MKYQIETTQEKVDEGENLIRENGGRVFTNSDHDGFSISGVEGKYTFEDGTLTIITQTNRGSLVGT